MPTKSGTVFWAVVALSLLLVVAAVAVAVAVLPLLPVVLVGWQAVPAARMATTAAAQASVLRLMVPPGLVVYV
ncbi:hypothetical protein [Streptomyces sp. NPDC003710]